MSTEQADVIDEDTAAALRLLDTLRQRQGLGQVRFENLLRRNAALRAMVRDRVSISEAEILQLHEIVHGAKRQARLIVVPTLTDARRILARLEGGEAFMDVAVAVSTDSSAPRGGLLEPISIADPSYPESLRAALWKLEHGDVSSPILLDGQYALLTLVREIPADGAHLEDVRAVLVALHHQEVGERELGVAEDVAPDLRQLGLGRGGADDRGVEGGEQVGCALRARLADAADDSRERVDLLEEPALDDPLRHVGDEDRLADLEAAVPLEVAGDGRWGPRGDGRAGLHARRIRREDVLGSRGSGGAMTILAAALGARDYAVIALAGAFTLAGLILAWLLMRLSGSVGKLSDMIEGVTKETVPLIHDVDLTVKGVNQEIERVDTIMASAQNVAQNASTISETVKLAVSNPLVKALAFFAGARRATKKFRED